MYASHEPGPTREGWRALNVECTSPSRMKLKQTSVSTCGLFQVVSLVKYVVVYRKVRGQRTSNIAARLFRRPPHPRSLILESLRGNRRHGLSEAALGFIS
jgi:hypothetical protein